MEALVTTLKEILSARREGFQESARKELARYVSEGHQDYKQYQYWNVHKYSRNLVEINKEFELIVLCWDVGQASPIHNHSVLALPRPARARLR